MSGPAHRTDDDVDDQEGNEEEEAPCDRGAKRRPGKKVSRYDSSPENVRLLRSRRLRSGFLARMYLEVLCMESVFWSFSVGTDLLLGERWSHRTLRSDANERYAQYVVFLLFYFFASMTVFKVRGKGKGKGKGRVDGLATVDVLLFGISFALGFLVVVFVHYPCTDFSDAFVSCVTLTLLNLSVSMAFILPRRSSGPPGAFAWAAVTLAVAAMDAGIYFLLELAPPIDYVSSLHFAYGAGGAAFCHLALVVVTSTVVRQQTKRLLDDAGAGAGAGEGEGAAPRKVLGREEPYIFATFHTFLSFMFVQLSFAMFLHYERVFQAWYEQRKFSFTDGRYCPNTEKEEEEEDNQRDNFLK